jgi:hypothetical protein
MHPRIGFGFAFTLSPLIGKYQEIPGPTLSPGTMTIAGFDFLWGKFGAARKNSVVLVGIGLAAFTLASRRRKS